MITKEELKVIEAEHDAAVRVADAVGKRLAAACVEMMQQEYGVKLGDRVLRKNAYYVVTRFYQRSYRYDKPWLYGYKVLKTGEVSRHDTLIYDEWKKL